MNQLNPIPISTPPGLQDPASQVSNPETGNLVHPQVARQSRNQMGQPVKAGLPKTLPQTNRNPAMETDEEAQSVNIQLPFWVLNTVMIGTAIVVVLWITAFIRSERLAAIQAERIEDLSGQLSADLRRTSKQLTNLKKPAARPRIKVKASPAKSPFVLIGETRSALKKNDEKQATIHLSELLVHPDLKHEMLTEAMLLSRERLNNPVLSAGLASRLLKQKNLPPLPAALAMEILSTRLNADQVEKQINHFIHSLGSQQNQEREQLIKAIANIHLTRGEYEALKASMKQIVNKYPNSASGYRNLAIANHALAESQPGLLNDPENRPDYIMDKAIKLSPQDHTLWYDLARYHWQAGHDISASKAIERAIRLAPENKTYHLVSAEIYQLMGNKDKAQWRLKVAGEL